MTCVSLQFDCDVTSALITAGNTFLVPEVSATQQAWFPEAEELLAIDAMSGANYKSLSFAKAVVELEGLLRRMSAGAYAVAEKP